MRILFPTLAVRVLLLPELHGGQERIPPLSRRVELSPYRDSR